MFKKFYDTSIKQIEIIIKSLKERNWNFVPRIYVGKYYHDSDDEEDSIPHKKCGLMGPRNKLQFHINKNN